MMSQQRLFAIVVVFFIPEVTGAVKGYVPRRCCSPDQFTASLKSTMTTYRHYTEQLQVVCSLGRAFVLVVGAVFSACLSAHLSICPCL